MENSPMLTPRNKGKGKGKMTRIPGGGGGGGGEEQVDEYRLALDEDEPGRGSDSKRGGKSLASTGAEARGLLVLEQSAGNGSQATLSPGRKRTRSRSSNREGRRKSTLLGSGLYSRGGEEESDGDDDNDNDGFGDVEELLAASPPDDDDDDEEENGEGLKVSQVAVLIATSLYVPAHRSSRRRVLTAPPHVRRLTPAPLLLPHACAILSSSSSAPTPFLPLLLLLLVSFLSIFTSLVISVLSRYVSAQWVLSSFLPLPPALSLTPPQNRSWRALTLAVFPALGRGGINEGMARVVDAGWWIVGLARLAVGVAVVGAVGGRVVLASGSGDTEVGEKRWWVEGGLMLGFVGVWVRDFVPYSTTTRS